MENEEQVTFYTGPAYALVIGISDYKHFGEPGKPLEDPQFPNLKVAHNDAQDFANFLNKSVFPKYSVRLLINQEATLSNIKEEFDTLRKNCKQSEDKNPLVIVYFSGHGWPDGDGRTYLIPYEAQRDRLYSTALLNREFSHCLDDLGTNRLVVFIDACQAGTIVQEGSKGPSDYVLPSEGRYVIASCGPMQNSYEWKEKKNSIFTGRLLQLLNFETDDFDDLEHPEVDLSDLFRTLRYKVAATAQNEYNAKQEPASDIKDRTGIVLAVNKKVSERKQKQRDEKHARRFLDLICNAIDRTTKPSPKGVITTLLMSYVIENETNPTFTGFYNVFDDVLNEWKKAEESGKPYNFEGACSLLIKRHKFASESPAPIEPISQESLPSPKPSVTAQQITTSFHTTSVLTKDPSQTIASTTLGQGRPSTQADLGSRQKPTSPYTLRIQAGSEEPVKPPAKVFVSYSHKDTRWLEEFKSMVAPLTDGGFIELWDDDSIDPGQHWNEEIEKAMAATDLAVLLVSKHFFNSVFIGTKELPRLLENAREKGMVIFWIMVSDCLVGETVIDTYQAAHDKRPLDSLSYSELQTVLKQISLKIKQAVLENR